MDFSANKALVEVIKEGVFGGTYFRDMVFMESRTKNH